MTRRPRPARERDIHELASAMPHVTVEDGTQGRKIYQVGGKSFVFFRVPGGSPEADMSNERPAPAEKRPADPAD